MDLELLINLILAGINSLVDYVALHVITCLIPAFLLAGAINTFLSKDVIIRYLGYARSKLVSFPLAAISSLGLAVCSCTIIPIASGLYKRGSSIGPAFIFLWTAPALNILAITYTGSILGLDFVILRIIGALSTSFLVGLIMVSIFRKEDIERSTKLKAGSSKLGASSPVKSRKILGLIILLVALLLLPNYLGVGRSYLEKFLIFIILLVPLSIYVWRTMSYLEIKAWINETLWFVRMIFPLLLAGVFIVGVIGAILPEAWVKSAVGRNDLISTFLANIIGALSYFSTMTEAPFVKMLLGLGMGKAPALALLLTGPGMSLPNMIAIMRIFHWKKGVVYIVSVIIISTFISLLLGNIF
ncbi:MAG: permease [Candidatus Methanomethyliales bacterium]|nr:permease [Candidatus Methanomethylicales archaeon]